MRLKRIPGKAGFTRAPVPPHGGTVRGSAPRNSEREGAASVSPAPSRRDWCRVNPRGFTLIEVLITITTFTIIAAAIYSSLSAGIRMWRRSNEMIGGLQSARVFFSLASSDLRNAVIYNPEGVNFEGSGSGMAFMSIVTGGGKERTQGPELAKVAYYLDSRTKTVKRIVAGKAKGFDIYKASPAIIFGEVEDKTLAFEYCYKSEFSKTGYVWKNKWQDTGKVPIGVRIKVNGFTRCIFIPTGKPGGEIQT